MPTEEFWDLYYNAWGYDPDQFAGYANGVIYLWSGNGLWARRLVNGEYLWGRSPAQSPRSSTAVASPVVGPVSPTASPKASDDDVRFIKKIAIDSGLVLVSLTNGHIWALDASTGDIRWDFDSERDSIGVPTVVDHVAYCGGASILALELLEQPVIRWRKEIQGRVLGVDGSHVFIGVATRSGGEIRALAVKTGRNTGGHLGSLGGTQIYGNTSSSTILEVSSIKFTTFTVVLNPKARLRGIRPWRFFLC